MAKRVKLAWVLWLAPFLLLMPLSGVARADAGIEGLKLEKEVDGLKVELVFASKTLEPGETALAVRISDAAGQPVEGLVVTLSAQLEAEEAGHAEADPHAEEAEDAHSADPHAEEAVEDPHAEMPEAEHASDGHSDMSSIVLDPGHAGEYQGAFDFSTAGQWQILLSLGGAEETKVLDFSVKVGGGSAKGIVLGGFLALNLGVLTVAAGLKQKRAAKS